MDKPVLVLQGPNLNMLGRRDPTHYGSQTLAEIHEQMQAKAFALGLHLNFIQSNHEGVLIDEVQGAIDNTSGLIINAGGYTHTSVALADAIEIYPHPVIEVHLSAIETRETFRHHSYISPHAREVIGGRGAQGYLDALESMAHFIDAQ